MAAASRTVPAVATHDRSSCWGGNWDSAGNAMWLCSTATNHAEVELQIPDPASEWAAWRRQRSWVADAGEPVRGASMPTPCSRAL